MLEKIQVHTVLSESPSCLFKYKTEWAYRSNGSHKQFEVPYLMYFTSTDEIKPGNKVLRNDGSVFECGTACTDHYIERPLSCGAEGVRRSECKKIVATIDKSLWYSAFASILCPKCESKLVICLPDHVQCVNCKTQLWDLVRGVASLRVKDIPKIPIDFLEAFVAKQGIWEVMLEKMTNGKYKLNSQGGVIIHCTKKKRFSQEDLEKATYQAMCHGWSNKDDKSFHPSTHHPLWIDQVYPK
jgi:hypothetical protein